MHSLTFDISSSLSILGPLVSPAKITLLVVVKVSQATLETGFFDKYVSTTMSEILSQTLSGCPSETDSLVKKNLLLSIFFIFIKLKDKQICS